MMSGGKRHRLSLSLNYDAKLLYSLRPTIIIHIIYFAPLHDATQLILTRNGCGTNRSSRGATQTMEGRKFECTSDSLRYSMKLSK